MSNLENREYEKSDRKEAERRDREKFDSTFDATAGKPESSITKAANGISEQTVITGAADQKKLAETSSALSAMAETEIAKLEKTVPAENATEFRESINGAKADFLSAAETVMANPKLDPAAKRDRIETLYRNFSDRVAEAQGKINGKYGKAAESAQMNDTKETADAEKKNRDFREKFEKAAEKAQIERMEQAARERIEAINRHTRAELADMPVPDSAPAAVEKAR